MGTNRYGWSWTCAALVAVLGCGGVGEKRQDAGLEDEPGVTPMAERTAMKAGSGGIAAMDIAQSRDADQTVSLVAAHPNSFERQIIKTVDMNLQVDSVDSALVRATILASRFGGYVASQSRSEAPPDGARSGTVVLKIPAEKTDQGLGELRALGKSTNETMWTQDVTEDFYDTTIRLRNAQTARAKFEEILLRATRVPEIVEIQRELSRVTEEMERINGHLRRLSNQIAFSTVTLNMSEPLPVLRDTTTVWGRLAEALRGMGDMFWRTVTGGIRLFGFVLPVAALGYALYWAVRFVWRLRRNKRALRGG